jgi:hypothetical protein
MTAGPRPDRVPPTPHQAPQVARHPGEEEACVADCQRACQMSLSATGPSR